MTASGDPRIRVQLSEVGRGGYDLQLTQYDDRGWRASFYTTGMEHSPTRRRVPNGTDEEK
jgi:hypothetical protein